VICDLRFEKSSFGLFLNQRNLSNLWMVSGAGWPFFQLLVFELASRLFISVYPLQQPAASARNRKLNTTCNMNKFRSHKGLVAPLARANVDTDQIIPKQFLKRIERTGFGQFLFYDWRFLADGSPNPGFILNEPQFAGASILVAGKNFGCGSSREHAPWALAEYGFRVIIATSFADIFSNNCLKNGLLPVVLAEADVAELIERAERNDGYQLTVDLERNLVEDTLGFSKAFSIDDFQRYCLLEGLDDIALTLRHESAIRDFESSHPTLKS
jgi:3-isopropylmalate/(R)-2-methylmalate dehydratase small subunit